MKKISRRSFVGAAAASIALGLPWRRAHAATLSIPFYSQLDPLWKGDKLGNSSSTIGSQGCAVTCLAMLLKYRGADVDPRKLNNWLKTNGGYTADGSIANWIIPGRYNGTSWMGYDSAPQLVSISNLASRLSSNQLVIAKSARFANSTHFVVLFSTSTDGKTGYYLDPYDPPATCTMRKIGDGWVNIGCSLRVYGPFSR